ncbi:uncharacterized protein PADG_11173 [Paracoccidioides brasiliensis Pb18]|uniref:Uncharacterized protein n=1 Tax=Paracoccidioides brasiliensis (strain Pb18) TaxID=502780 RepID=A0A0A0HZH5_PARBD|nr:uncharacterized protein PADG_11173 [Paracoccidioides brasiliensis Pb18]KGM92715.1 hypothetical protein PADG_11173 [Paracoccidioides brasiliensis Pb18]
MRRREGKPRGKGGNVGVYIFEVGLASRPADASLYGNYVSAQNQRPQRQSKPNNTNTKKLWERAPFWKRTENPEIASRQPSKATKGSFQQLVDKGTSAGRMGGRETNPQPLTVRSKVG